MHAEQRADLAVSFLGPREGHAPIWRTVTEESISKSPAGRLGRVSRRGPVHRGSMHHAAL